MDIKCNSCDNEAEIFHDKAYCKEFEMQALMMIEDTSKTDEFNQLFCCLMYAIHLCSDNAAREII